MTRSRFWKPLSPDSVELVRWRPPQALPARRHPARALAARVHGGPHRLAACPRPPRRPGAPAGRAARRHPRGPALRTTQAVRSRGAGLVAGHGADERGGKAAAVIATSGRNLAILRTTCNDAWRTMAPSAPVRRPGWRPQRDRTGVPALRRRPSAARHVRLAAGAELRPRSRGCAHRAHGHPRQGACRPAGALAREGGSRSGAPSSRRWPTGCPPRRRTGCEGSSGPS